MTNRELFDALIEFMMKNARNQQQAEKVLAAVVATLVIRDDMLERGRSFSDYRAAAERAVAETLDEPEGVLQ
jgi:hypothetical protein